MSQKIAAEDCPKAWSGPIAEKPPAVVVREYEEERDKAGVERMEMRCEVTGQRPGPDNKKKKKRKKKKEAFLVTDLLGDPLCRVRSFPLHVMLVAEWGEGGEIVGVIRGCIKRVKITANDTNPSSSSSDSVKAANVLGLRVSPSHRRHGIAARLVQEMEGWCKRHGADYAYMATDATNSPSLKLFTAKCGFIKYRTPTLLVRPVHAHREPPGIGSSIVRIAPRLAESMYRRVLAGADFFPEDMGEIVAHALSLGTFVAIPDQESAGTWDPESGTLPPSSFAVASVWNTKGVYNLRVKGASGFARACCAGSRMLDSCVPWLRIPSLPDVFKRFGFYFLYGLYMTGKHGPSLMKSLCDFAHNMARDDAGCAAVVAEVGPGDPVKAAIPHWKRFSWSEDVWCIKLLGEELVQKHGDSDWVHMAKGQSPVLFVDPRDV